MKRQWTGSRIKTRIDVEQILRQSCRIKLRSAHLLQAWGWVSCSMEHSWILCGNHARSPALHDDLILLRHTLRARLISTSSGGDEPRTAELPTLLSELSAAE
jgi:hypothetical protein